MRRVVVTGLGAVTPFGVGVNSMWKRLCQGASAIGPEVFEGHADMPCKVSARVPVAPASADLAAFDPARDVPAAIRSSTPRCIQYAVAAAREALNDAGWAPQTEEERCRTGVAIGSGMGSLDDVVAGAETLRTGGRRKVGPHFIPRILINLAGGHVSILHGLKGPNHAAVTACATGAHGVGDAANFIRLGYADVMLGGGTESCITPLAFAGFCKIGALASKFNDQPQAASRPFDRDRAGFVMGEGAGILVLEERQHAIARGARIYAELTGYGLTGDAHHITHPDDAGSGAYRAMDGAVRQAGRTPGDVDYINAHATSTPLGDAAENAAIKRLFGEHARSLSVSSSKGALGHLLGAAGAVEAAITVLAVHHGFCPPTVNLHNVEPEFDLDYVPVGKERRVRHALTNSFGFGGTNVSLLFSAHDAAS